MESAVWFLKKIQINQDWILNTDKICSFHSQNIYSVAQKEISKKKISKGTRNLDRDIVVMHTKN